MTDLAVDDAKVIKARLDQIQSEERQMTSLDEATGIFLDAWGRRYGVERKEEGDYAFRARIRDASK